MNPRLALLLISTLALPIALRADPAPGASRDQVISELGQPSSRMGVASRELLTYDRGTVLLIDGKVNKVDLMTPAEITRLADERAADERAKKEEAAQIETRMRSDEAALSALMDTEAWKSAGGADRVTMLLRFSTEHPYADIRNATAASERVRDKEADLNARILIAQNKAAEAHDRAAAAKNRRQGTGAASDVGADNDNPTILYGTTYRTHRRHRDDKPPVVKPVAPAPDINRATPDPKANQATPDMNANRATPPNPVAPRPSPKPAPNTSHSGSKERTA